MVKVLLPPISQRLVDDSGQAVKEWYDKLKFLERLQPLSDIPAATPQTLTIAVQKFTADGTYTPTAGMDYCIIEVVGSGGGGGGGTGTNPGTFQAGGGGAGEYARLLASAATIGASQAVTVGAAGTGAAAGNNNGNAGADVSVGSLCVGKGGAAGTFVTAATRPTGGAGGNAGTGDLLVAGSDGSAGLTFNGTAMGIASVGNGGDSVFGRGGKTAMPAVGAAVNGAAGTGFGSGGGGGSMLNTAGTVAGGDGKKGVVVITEYILT